MIDEQQLAAGLQVQLPIAASPATPIGRLAFVSERDGNRGIYVMNPDGTNQRRLTYDGAEDSSPAWSPDGSRIAFVSHRDGNQEIYSMRADGSALPWSPDGTRVAYSNTTLISISDLNNQETVELDQLATASFMPAWSPR